ncbi:MAG: F0F1 ATP synthase subunit gamma [Acidobacteria bacterium]|nr:F0F1 ATP synthase subunit gamma [Acidobacteriota bacterium]MBW4043393.1 F0F1 ATP synthase subunit gamma [Acidobacteriota bacterium]
MANVLDLRRRIRSVRNTRQITKAMKMVSAAKLRRAQERALTARPYAAMLTSVLQSLKRRADVYDPTTGDLRHPLLMTREEKNILLVVVSGDKGFAGAFNANIIKAATKFLNENGDKQIDVEALGRKGRDLFRRRFPAARYSDAQPQEEGQQEAVRRERHRSNPIEFVGESTVVLDKVRFDDVRALGEEIVARYTHEEIDAAYIVYNEFKSVIQQRIVVERVLPIIEPGRQEVTAAEEMTQEERRRTAEAAASAGVSLEAQQEADEEEKRFGTADVDYIYEQSPREIFNAILPRYITAQLYHAVIESVAAENAARMTAMDSATNNASEMIDSLTLTMNRVRQAAITKEIIEIVSGASALS